MGNILLRWKEHLQKLLSSNAETDETVVEKMNRASTMHEPEKEITMVELDKALNSKGNRKSPGLDGVCAEIYKN